MIAPPPSGIGPPPPLTAATPDRHDGAPVAPSVALRRFLVGDRYAAVVVGATPEGRPKVAVGPTTLILDGVEPLPAGTRLALAITAVAPALELEVTIRGENSAILTRTTLSGEPTPSTARPASAARADPRNAPPVAAIRPRATAAPTGPIATLLTPIPWRAESSAAAASTNDPRQPSSLPVGTRLTVRVLPANAPPTTAAGATVDREGMSTSRIPARQPPQPVISSAITPRPGVPPRPDAPGPVSVANQSLADEPGIPPLPASFASVRDTRPGLLASPGPALSPSPSATPKSVPGLAPDSATVFRTSSSAEPPTHPSATALAPGARVAATVSAVLPDGRSVVTLVSGEAVVLAGVAGLEPEASMQLVLGDILATPRPAAPSAVRPGDTPGAPWASLVALLRGADADAPAHTQGALATALPRPDGSLGERVRALLAAARSGDPAELLGREMVEGLDHRHPEILAALVRDLEGTARAAEPDSGRPAGDGWIGLDLPLLVGTAVEPMRLMLRRRSAPSRPGTGRGDERFVLEVTLGRLGRIQLDTMVRTGSIPSSPDLWPAAAPARLDVVVRSERPLDPAVCADIRALAGDAGDATGVRVAVGFQSCPSGFVDLPPKPPTGAGSSLSA